MQHLGREAYRLGPKQKRVGGPIVQLVVAHSSVAGEGIQGPWRAGFVVSRQRLVLSYVGPLPVVETGPAKLALVEGEPEGLNQVQCGSGVGT